MKIKSEKSSTLRRLIADYPQFYWKEEEGDFFGSNKETGPDAIGIIVYSRDGWIVADADGLCADRSSIDASGMDPDDHVVAVRCALRNLEKKKGGGK